MTTEEKLIRVTPSPRQLRYQETEFYAFFHFGMNTFSNREWGNGKECPKDFYPAEMDAEQWINAIKAAGMKGAILTCKHHDGFCLWPSRYTSHSIKNSPYQNGKGDIVREVSEACRRHGLKFGIYLSPWDRNQSCYGTGKEYDDYYIAQLTELLTGYGPVFSVWLDGACGEGKNGKKQRYDWERYYACVRKYQPDACISVCGPDIRWCGNEAGDVRESEWSVVPARLALAESIQDKSQQSDDEEFRKRKLSSDMEDLGSRKVLEGEEDLIWYPAEVNTSIRPGWFYHQAEDAKVKSLEELIHIYCGSVGGNGMFLLNIPPMPNGRIHENDVNRLKEFGRWKEQTFAVNLVNDAEIYADTQVENHPVTNLCTEILEKWYQPTNEKKSAEITVRLKKALPLSYLVLQEAIQFSQRVEAFEVYTYQEDAYVKIYDGTVIGYKKIISISGVHTEKVKIVIKESRGCPKIAFLGIYGTEMHTSVKAEF